MLEAIRRAWLMHDLRWWHSPRRACVRTAAAWLAVYVLLRWSLAAGTSWAGVILMLVVVPALAGYTITCVVTVCARGLAADTAPRELPGSPADEG